MAFVFSKTGTFEGDLKRRRISVHSLTSSKFLTKPAPVKAATCLNTALFTDPFPAYAIVCERFAVPKKLFDWPLRFDESCIHIEHLCGI